MNTLRELCSPPYTHVDQHGRAVIDTDRVQLAIAREEALIGRLVADLARAWGISEDAVRLRYGLKAPRPTQDTLGAQTPARGGRKPL